MRGLVIGTGPSLADQIDLIPRFKGLVFGPNNTHRDIPLDVWLACDPQWHEHYGQVNGVFEKWHWSSDICARFGYKFVEGVWMDGLWMDDETKISYNHCSSAQLLNLACNQYKCSEVILIGHDFKYAADQPRHYFDGLSDMRGEYPSSLRKWSTFDGLIETYRHIGEQTGLPPIINCTPDSALPWFPVGDFNDYVGADLA